MADPVVGNAIDPYNINLTNPTLLQTLTGDGNIGKSVQHQDQLQATADGTLFHLGAGAARSRPRSAPKIHILMTDTAPSGPLNSPLAQQYGGTIVGGSLSMPRSSAS